MRTAGSILGVALAAALAACAHHAQTGAQAPAQAQGTTATACPLAQLRGVHATVADIKGGVAITFTAPQSEVDQLRDNIKSMEDANDKQGDPFAVCPCAQTGGIGAAEAMPGERAPTAMQPGAATMLPRSDVKVEDISTGAVLRLTAKDSAQVGALRAAARQNVHAFKTACMGQGPQGAPGGMEPAPGELPNR